MRSVRNILCVSCGYAAALIGAGFASGQEIVSFFLRYGKISIVGILIACLIFTLFSYVVLATCVENRIVKYSEFALEVFKGRKTVAVAEGITVIFAVMSVCVMAACAGEMATVLFSVNKIVGTGVFMSVCGIIFLLDAKKMLEINSLLGGIIVFGIIFSCFYILRYREQQTFLNETRMVVSGAVYAGYNLLTAGAVLSGMSSLLNDKKDVMLSSVVSGIILFVMITLIWGVLGIYCGKINLGEIPMLTMALRQNKMLGAFYGVMLIFAVLTTGVSNGFCVIDALKEKYERKNIILFLTVCGFCFGGAGFENLINTAYRACGYVGMIVVFNVIYKFFEKVDKSRKKKIQEENKSKICEKFS